MRKGCCPISHELLFRTGVLHRADPLLSAPHRLFAGLAGGGAKPIGFAPISGAIWVLPITSVGVPGVRA